MTQKLLGAFLLAHLFVCCTTLADEVRSDAHAPIGVMGDHAHRAGEVMLSYRYMAMRMAGNRNGTSRIGTEKVLRSGTGNYMIAPTEMDMEMHMLGVMYAPSDSVTLMTMIPWTKNSMDHVMMTGARFSTESSHVGDISVSALLPFGENNMWTLGVSIPTGDQDLMDRTPMGQTVLPYPMQIGSGTYDLIVGIGKSVLRARDSYGGQLRGIYRTGSNDNGYSLGSHVTLSAWYAFRPTPHLSFSVRGLVEHRGNYDGADPRYAMALANNMVPTVDPTRRGGQRADLVLGINFAHTGGIRLALEYQLPVWQNLDGPQLEIDGVLTAGWQLAL